MMPTLGFILIVLAFILAVLRFFISDGRLTAGAVLCLLLGWILGVAPNIRHL